MELAENKTYRILVMAFLFFLSGLWFFLGGGGREIKESPIEEIRLGKSSSLPEPENFFHFVHDPDRLSITIDGVCYDSYYTILIFPQSADYRYDSLAAVYNQAKKCPKSKMFLEKINLTSPKMNFEEEYYIIKAQQGKKGTWYAPY